MPELSMVSPDLSGGGLFMSVWMDYWNIGVSSIAKMTSSRASVIREVVRYSARNSARFAPRWSRFDLPARLCC